MAITIQPRPHLLGEIVFIGFYGQIDVNRQQFPGPGSVLRLFKVILPGDNLLQDVIHRLRANDPVANVAHEF